MAKKKSATQEWSGPVKVILKANIGKRLANAVVDVSAERAERLCSRGLAVELNREDDSTDDLESAKGSANEAP